MRRPRAPGSPSQRGISALALGLLVAAACNGRFEFDTGPASGGTSPMAGTNSAAGTLATGGAGAGGTAGGGADSAGSAGVSGLAGSMTSGTGGSAAGNGAAGNAAAGAESEGTCGGVTCPESLHCGAGACQECTDNGHCSGTTPYCDTTLYRCVSCLDSSNCSEEGFTCDARMHHCLKTCTGDLSCTPAAEGCSEATHTCHQCDENEECLNSPTGKVCAKDGSGCVQCTGEADCPGRHCDQLTGRCVACRGATDCASKLCDVAKGECL